jgi:hypothetical protein
MINNQPISNNNISYKTTEYKHKTCAGLHCKNTPTHYLKLAVIKRSGWFCHTRTQNLQKESLVEAIFNDNVETGGESSFGEV